VYFVYLQFKVWNIERKGIEVLAVLCLALQQFCPNFCVKIGVESSLPEPYSALFWPGSPPLGLPGLSSQVATRKFFFASLLHLTSGGLLTPDHSDTCFWLTNDRLTKLIYCFHRINMHMNQFVRKIFSARELHRLLEIGFNVTEVYMVGHRRNSFH